MGALEGFLKGVKRAGEVVEGATRLAGEVNRAIPRLTRLAEEFQQGLGQATKAAQEMQDAIAPITRAVVPSPYPPDVLEAAGILGLTMPITAAELAETSKAALLRAHPDRGGSVARVKRVIEARKTLKDWCSG